MRVISIRTFRRQGHPFWALLLATCTVAVTPAAAQDRLFIGTGEIGSAGRFAERLGVAPSAVYGEFVDGGRIVVDGATAYDTTTGQAAAVQGGEVLAGDPALPRVFTFDGQTVSAFRIDTSQLTPLVPAQAASFLSVVTARYAPAAGLLFVRRPAAGGGGEIVVVDVATATVVRTLLQGWAIGLGWSVSPDGRRLVVNASSASPGVHPAGLLVIDAASGALLSAQPPRPSVGPETLVDDRRFERTYLLGRSELAAYDDGAQLLGALPVRSSCASPTMSVSAHTGRVYVVDSVGGGQVSGQPVPIHHYLSVYDGTNGRFIASSEVTGAAGVPAGTNSCSSLPIAVVTAPGPPRHLAATVAGRDLSLSWSDGGGITADYVLEVGLSPGQTIATVSLGNRTAAAFTQVPPGRYVARLRATNPFGVSRPSEDVVIVVP